MEKSYYVIKNTFSSNNYKKREQATEKLEKIINNEFATEFITYGEISDDNK